MKFIRILPETWARPVAVLQLDTEHRVGKDSLTVASTGWVLP